MRIEELIARDGCACVWCGREAWRSDLTVEHLLPRSRGGTGVPENLALACRACNRRRRSRCVAAYVRAQLADGRGPRIDLLARALRRLASSEARGHADYGRRQLALLERLSTHGSRPAGVGSSPGRRQDRPTGR